ncbi:MAG: hypothetical protein COW29_04615 [Rhodobacterales bacterium CG15_BIG_FIL_POST_REV_8_21_14_020_59_13]|nr:MAG: hypothetical protein COW29_04615 [Rhodobacterales bacterium CG15_BIG_FIL_POST_REV_8_21_14_020_59_13]
MSAENKLNAFLQADAAPDRDPVFMAALEERMARIRLHARLRRHAVLAIAASAVVFGLIKASGLSMVGAVAQFAADLAATPGLALAGLIVAGAMLLPRILPGNGRT